MTIRKSTLLAATASVALLAIPPTGAMAFDVVDWEWDKNVVEDWDIDISIQDSIDPSGIVQVEKLQMHFGDIEAKAIVKDVENNPRGEGDGTGIVTVPVEGAGSFSLTYIDPAAGIPPGSDPNAGVVNEITVEDETGLDLTLSGGNADENFNTISDIDYTISGEVEVDLANVDFGEAYDAVDLPSIENAATAVANNQDISSSSAVMLHDAQIGVGDINSLNGEGGNPDALAFIIGAVGLTLVDDELEGINAHTDIAALTILGAATGFVESADIDAYAQVDDIVNATVDNAATAVTNNMSVAIAAATAGDATMIADITQVGIADVEATAIVGSHYGGRGGYDGPVQVAELCFEGCGGWGDPSVEINNYNNLRVLEGPIVSNVATAVGNNLSIEVNGPGTD